MFLNLFVYTYIYSYIVTKLSQHLYWRWRSSLDDKFYMSNLSTSIIRKWKKVQYKSFYQYIAYVLTTRLGFSRVIRTYVYWICDLKISDSGGWGKGLSILQCTLWGCHKHGRNIITSMVIIMSSELPHRWDIFLFGDNF